MATAPAQPSPPPQGPSSTRYALARPIALLLVVLWVLATWAGVTIFQSVQRTAGMWGCEMSYMTPSYQKLDWKENPAPRYSLYLYREAGFDPQAPSGHPVIFIPGNAGSFMQVRSIASSASRQYFSTLATDRPWRQPLDVFAADFNEDLSALHAPTLQEQGVFLASAIPRVLKEYSHLPEHLRPTKVTLLGHSMGGIVARLAVVAVNTTSVDAVITMSTPHSQPPIAMEAAMQTLYDTINSATDSIHRELAPLLISICGGQSDTQIISDACALSSSVITSEDGFATFTTGIPGVWTGVEHQAMVWCHQVRWRVARALLDMSSKSAREEKLHAARHWLLDSTQLGNPLFQSQDHVLQKIDADALNKSIIVHVPGSSDISLADPPLAVRYCQGVADCEHQYPAIQVIPWISDAGKPFPSPGEGSRPEESAFVIDLDSLPEATKWVEVSAPRGATIFTGLHSQITPPGSHWVSQSTAPPSAHIALLFDRTLLSSVAVWSLQLGLGECSGPHPIAHYKSHPVNILQDTTTESRFFPVRRGESIPLHSHISGSPFQSGDQWARGLEIHLYQQPGCIVERVEISLNISASLAKAILRWRVAVVAWIVGWIAVALALQLGDFARNGNIPSFNKVAMQGVPAVVATVFGLLAIHAVQSIGAEAGVSLERLSLGYTNFLHAPFTVIVALWSLGAAVVLHNIVYGLVLFVGRLSGKPRRSEVDIGQRLTKAILPRLMLALLLLLSVVLVIPAGMAQAALLLVFLALTSGAMYDDDRSRFNLLITNLSLMLLLLPLNLPEVAVWGKNLWSHGGRMFSEDHTILPVLPTLILVLLCSFDDTKRPAMANSRGRTLRWVQVATKLAALVAFSLGPHRPYLLLPAANMVFLASSWLIFKSERFSFIH